MDPTDRPLTLAVAGEHGTLAAADDDTPTASKRSRRRRNVIGGSPHRDEIAHLLRAGWTSITIERYLAHRYGFDCPAATIRQYRVRKKIVPARGLLAADGSDVTAGSIADVIGIRADLIRLQVARVRLDATREFGTAATSEAAAQPGEGLRPGTRHEIALLSDLLDAHKLDLQQLGLLPTDGAQEFRTPVPAGPAAPDAAAPRRTLAEVFNDQGIDEVTAARRMHDLLPRIQQAGDRAV